MNLELTDARVLVGGASRGLGLAISEALAAEGARVALNARDSPALHAAADRLGGVAVDADLAQGDGPRSAVARTVEALGGLDLLVVNSGGPAAGEFRALDRTTWRAAIDGTLLSAIGLIEAALTQLDRAPAPAIVVVLSSSVRVPIPGLATSNVLRPGLAGLVKSLSIELAPAVRVNGVAPGRLDTARVAQLDAGRAERRSTPVAEIRRSAEAGIPLGRYGEPRELADVVAFLLSRRASYLTGQIVGVDGGMAKSLP